VPDLSQLRSSFGITGTTLVGEETVEGRASVNIRLGATQYLVEAIDETLRIFGLRTCMQIYSYLERSYALKRLEIPERLEVFSTGLNSLFGSASKLIELRIVKSFYSKLGVKFEQIDGYSFPDYLVAAQHATRGLP
jgi:hypothetical protein